MLRLDCAILHTPLEIRQQIYSYQLPSQIHVFLRNDRLCLSTCLEPDKNKWSSNSLEKPTFCFYGGQERRKGGSDVEWARRLQSSWGPHWMCEENIDTMSAECMSLLLLCRRMYTEVMDFLAHTAVFHVTDVDTLNHLATMTKTGNITHFSGVPSLPHRGITRLSITLRRPLEFFQALEESPENTSGQSRRDAQSWKQLSSTLSNFSNVTKLSLWLDHSEICTWSVVNERTLLSSLLAHVATTGIKLTVILPKLHPSYERESRHFVEKTPLGQSILLHRSIRQRYHSHETRSGVVEVLHKPDFPMFVDAEIFHDHMSMAEIEEWERASWNEDSDVEALYQEATEFTNENLSCLL